MVLGGTGGRFVTLKIGPKIVVGFVGWKSLGQIILQAEKEKRAEVEKFLVSVRAV